MRQGRGSLKEYEEGLQQAMALQRQVVEAVRGDHPDLVAAHKQAAAEMQTELASLYASQHKMDLVSLCSLCIYVCVCVCVSLPLPVSSVCQSISLLLSVCLSVCHWLFQLVCLTMAIVYLKLTGRCVCLSCCMCLSC